MILSKKVRLFPTEKQEKKMWQSVGTARFIYNWTLYRQQENYANGGKFISNNDLRKEITQLKKTDEFKWLNEVSNNIPKQAIKDACKAYTDFFKGLHSYPKFKSKKKSRPSFYNDTEALEVKENMVLIEKVGWVKVKENISIGFKYTNPRISYDGKYWYLTVGIEQVQAKATLTKEVIGIDLGIKDLAVCSNGITIPNVNKTKTVRTTTKRLKRLQHKISNKYEMNKTKDGKFVKTNNIKEMEKRAKMLHRRLTNIRKNYTHQATNSIVKTKPSKIVLEDLNVKGMMKNRHLSEAIAQQMFHEFKRQIQYKCEKYGIEFVVADRWYPSTKTCSACGNTKPKMKLNERRYICEHCGINIDRDYNASINLSKYILK